MENALIYIFIIFFMPFFSFLLNALFPNSLKNIVGYVSLLILFISLIISTVNFYTFYNDANWSFLDWNIYNGLKLIEFPFISISDFHIGFGLNFDKLTVFMLWIINLISFIFHLHFFESIENKSRLSICFSYLGLFVFSINGIIISNNLFFTFIFWKIASFSSYLLINFSNDRNLIIDSFRKVFLNDKISDLAISFGIMLLYFKAGTFSFNTLQFSTINNSLMIASGLLIVLGLMYRTIKLIIYYYLPKEMKLEISLSELFCTISMLVPMTYLLIRFFPFLTEEVLHVLALAGSMIALFGSLIALNQYHLVKIIAYCSISQLGYIICAIGVGSFFAGFFHLLTYIIFISCISLSFAPFIKMIKKKQNIISVRQQKSKSPITFAIILVSVMSICGFPLFLGFLSHKSILAGAISYHQNFGELTFIIPLFIFTSIFITNFYMVRLILLLFYADRQPIATFISLSKYSYFFAVVIIVFSFSNFASIFVFPNINPFYYYGWFYNMMSKIVPYETLGYDMYAVTRLTSPYMDYSTIYLLVATMLGASLAIVKYLLDRNFFHSTKK